MVSENELVKRCLEGQIEDFGVLVGLYRIRITSFCYYRTGDYCEAQDLAQETFIKAYFDLHSLREPAKFGSWLKAIAFRLCQSWHRRKRSVTALPLEELISCVGSEAQSENEIVVHQALSQLSEVQKQVLILRYINGYSLSEAADLQGVPIETVRTRLRRAKRNLREVWFTMMQEKTSGEEFTQRVLEKVELVQTESGLIWPIYACLHSVGKDWPLSYVMGIMGIAFQFAVDEQISENGPTHVLDWGQWFDKIQNLGLSVSVFNAQLKSFSPSISTNTEDEFHSIQKAAWDAVRTSIDGGVPAIAWMPMTLEQKAQGLCCEYGLLVGYDNKSGIYQVRLPWQPMYTVPWDGFGRADPVNWFNVIVFGKEKPLDQRKLELDTLVSAVEHAHSAQHGYGLRGYTAWLEALDANRIQSNGSIRNAQLLKESREHAAFFLSEIALNFPDMTLHLQEAAQQYRNAVKAWEEYIKIFTPDISGTIHDQSKRTLGRKAVEEAYTSEQAAIKALESALGL